MPLGMLTAQGLRARPPPQWPTHTLPTPSARRSRLGSGFLACSLRSVGASAGLVLSKDACSGSQCAGINRTLRSHALDRTFLRPNPAQPSGAVKRGISPGLPGAVHRAACVSPGAVGSQPLTPACLVMNPQALWPRAQMEAGVARQMSRKRLVRLEGWVACGSVRPSCEDSQLLCSGRPRACLKAMGFPTPKSPTSLQWRVCGGVL